MTYELLPLESDVESKDETGDKEERETMVLLHGYGGSGMIFFWVMQALHEKYKVYMVDLMGMGRSSRPEFEAETTEDAENFFVHNLEIWW